LSPDEKHLIVASSEFQPIYDSGVAVEKKEFPNAKVVIGFIFCAKNGFSKEPGGLWFTLTVRSAIHFPPVLKEAK